MLNDYSTTLTISSNIPPSLVKLLNNSICCDDTLQRLSECLLYKDVKTWRKIALL